MGTSHATSWHRGRVCSRSTSHGRETIEPVVGTIFVKLGLHPDAGINRRVLAVLAYLRS
jgi:hypothetical protein